ncbi:MAG: hypothetical protein JWL84_4055 [Rhodospirillales bacterium]|nr:hypothetical protein [Rhodospirillales bacterium]
MRHGIPFLASLSLAACAMGAPPHIVNSTPEGVSIAFTGDDVHGASVAATDYCDQLHKFATLRRIDRVGYENVGIFSCDAAKPAR